MKTVTSNQVARALQAVGLQRGDTVLVHSAIQYLGQPIGGTALYWRALQEILGPESTVAVPAFNFQFANGKPYDPASSPSIGMGSFAEYVRCLPGAPRTSHPMQSLAAVGKYAADLASRDTPSAFDPGSAFERLLNVDARILLLGADIYAVSLVHYSEQRAEVPYRYWKEFSGQVLTVDGWQERTYRMFVRDLELNPRLDLSPIERLLKMAGDWKEEKLNYGRIALFNARAFVRAADELLAEDPWCLVVLPDGHDQSAGTENKEL
jgi:aminoglycoside N3'-acetyltransferase